MRQFTTFALSLLSASLFAAPPQFAMEKKMPIPGDGGWDCINIDSSSHRLWISRGSHVQVLNVETGAIDADIPNTNGVHAIVFASGKAYISCGRDDSVAVVDLGSLKETKRIKVGSRPDVMLADGNRVYSFNAGSQDASAIDASTDTVVGTAKLSGKPEFAVSDGHGTIYVNLEDKSQIERFNAKTFASEGTWSLSPAEEPTGLGIDRGQHLLFSACANKMMAITDFKAGKVVATPAIGNGPDGAGFDAGLAFSPNGQDGTLTIIAKQGSDWAPIQTVTTQRGARTMALDSRTHKIYLIAAEYQAPPAGSSPNARPRMVPGSAVILVVAPVKG